MIRRELVFVCAASMLLATADQGAAESNNEQAQVTSKKKQKREPAASKGSGETSTSGGQATAKGKAAGKSGVATSLAPAAQQNRRTKVIADGLVTQNRNTGTNIPKGTMGTMPKGSVAPVLPRTTIVPVR